MSLWTQEPIMIEAGELVDALPAGQDLPRHGVGPGRGDVGGGDSYGRIVSVLQPRRRSAEAHRTARDGVEAILPTHDHKDRVLFAGRRREAELAVNGRATIGGHTEIG